MHRANKLLPVFLIAIFLVAFGAYLARAEAPKDCKKPVYLTFDTGHMGVAELVAEVLQRQQVRVTFFAAQERTRVGDGSLGEHWAPWWRARAAEGHEFASHTLDHVYWRADVASEGGLTRFRVRPSAGADEGREMVWDARQYCAQIQAASDRLATSCQARPTATPCC